MLWKRTTQSPLWRPGLDKNDHSTQQESILNMTKEVTEHELKTRSVALRITEKMLDDNIAAINYLNVGEAIASTGGPDHDRHHCLTVCTIILKNGFVVTGESCCVNRENYNQDIGQRIALANAREKIWPLMGYELRERQYQLAEAGSEKRHDALGTALTQLLARAYGNETALTAVGARVILAYVEDAADQIAKFDGDKDGRIGGSRPKPKCGACFDTKKLHIVEGTTTPAHDIDCPVCVGTPIGAPSRVVITTEGATAAAKPWLDGDARRNGGAK